MKHETDLLSIKKSIIRQQNRHIELGRTMTELLAVLAIMGILSVIAVLGLGYTMKKREANNIVHDGRMAYTWTEAIQEELPETWTPITGFIPESGKVFSYLVDIAERRHIKVEDVKEGVCQQMLAFSGNTLSFYTVENQPFTKCTESNEIVMSFDGNGKIAECLVKSDCAEDNEFCMDGECQGCGYTYQVNEAENGCECETGRETKEDGTCSCLAGTELTCQDDQGHEWCCGNNTICGTEQGENQCIESDDHCSFNVAATNVNNLSLYKADCSFNVAATSDDLSLYKADCSYNIPEKSTFASDYTTKGDLTEGTPCPNGKYCAIFWTQETWKLNENPTVADGSKGTVFGKCQPLNVFSQAGLDTIGGNGTKGMVTENTGCSENEYCAIFWTQETWKLNENPTLSDGFKGTVFGKCQPLNVFSQAGLTSVSGEEAKNLMSQIIGCPAEKYCVLYYENGNCSDRLEDTDTGTIEGYCDDLSGNHQTCPY